MMAARGCILVQAFVSKHVFRVLSMGKTIYLYFILNDILLLGCVRSFDIEKRCASGPCLGQRWIAGKVVSENYGDEKQQHTFTVSDF